MFNTFKLYPFVRPLLFSVDAETAHEMTLKSLQKANQCKITRELLKGNHTLLPTTLMGLPLRNPIGLAAGLDKNGECIDAFGQLGFGFIEVGTVTPRAQQGNPKPRMFRLPQAESLINRMGFNNQGLDTFLKNVQNSEWRGKRGVLGLNIGKNADTPIENAASDYLIGLEGVYPFADYVTINISSPNTKNLRALQEGNELNHLLGQIADKRKELADRYGRRVPVVVKIAPDLEEEQIQAIAGILPRFEIDGVIATNTTLSRKALQGLKHSEESGGLSGPPVHELSLKVIESLRKEMGQDFTIIGVGGINSGKQALEKINAGANAVQLYTGLIYQGPKLIADCVNALRKCDVFMRK